MRERWLFLAAAALALQALAVALVSGVERPPPVPDLASFPGAIGDWQRVGEDLLSDDVARNLGADARITSTWLDHRTGLFANLLVAWFQSQRGGARQPHSPKVCLPATGWEPRESGILTLPFPSGAITVNRLLMPGNNQPAPVTYSNQRPRPVM